MSSARSVSRVAVLAVAAALVVTGCGGGGGSGPVIMRSTESSWIQGQPPLTNFPAYLAVAVRANHLGSVRFAARTEELALLEARRIAAKKRAKAAALRAYRAAVRRARAAYQAALRRAAIERRKQLKKLAARRRKRARELAKLRRKLHVPPGQECSVPQVRKFFHCQGGQLPTNKP
jgi:hypothetical protein